MILFLQILLIEKLIESRKIKASINNKNILITGGGGSIGSELIDKYFF